MANKNSIGLSDFVKGYVPAESNYGAFMQSETANKIHEVVHTETLTEPIVATFFWDILSKTNYYNSFLNEELNVNTKNVDDIIVVRHGDGQYSLLVLVKGYTGEVTVTNSNKCPRGDIIKAYEQWKALNNEALNSMEYNLAENFGFQAEARISSFRDLSFMLRSVTPEFIFSIFSVANMNIMVSRSPEKIITTENWTASPFHSVVPAKGMKPNSTAGIYATNNKGIFGVTVCLHSIDKPRKNKEVEINGVPGKVISIDKISDSCFVAIPKEFKINNLLSCNGPLQILPKKNEIATFEGLTSGPKTALVDQWNPELLSPISQNQRAIYTNAVTDRGDSGAVLINEEGMAMGFSFLRSGIDEEPGYSKWIWANSVFQIHNLKY